MNILEANVCCGGGHIVVLGAGASIASALRNPEMNGLSLPSMSNLAKVIPMNDLLRGVPEDLYSDNFETLYSNLFSDNPRNRILSEMNNRIYEYFASMRLPAVPTIYDYLVMSLRDRDMIASFNWDPFLYQAWCRNYGHGSKPGLCFLHGNVAIGFDEKTKRLGPANSISRDGKMTFVPTQLLFPVANKEYDSDPFISLEWDILRGRLASDTTKRVTIFGYSAPVTDVEAKRLMSEAWGTPNSRNMEQFELIDIRPEDEVCNSWNNFIHTHHYDYCTDFFQSSIARYPRRTSEAFFYQYEPMTAEEAFVEEYPIPQGLASLEEMWNWYQPFIEKEL